MKNSFIKETIIKNYFKKVEQNHLA